MDRSAVFPTLCIEDVCKIPLVGWTIKRPSSAFSYTEQKYRNHVERKYRVSRGHF